MLSILRKTLMHVAGLLLVMASATMASAQQSIQGGTAQPGDIICLAPVTVPVFLDLKIVASAYLPGDPNTGVVVKWIAFDAGTTPNTRVLKIVAASIPDPPAAFARGNGDQFYACINNNSGVPVTFNLSQSVTAGP